MLRKWLEIIISIFFSETGQLPHTNGMDLVSGCEKLVGTIVS
jgi:hypothetical protein